MDPDKSANGLPEGRGPKDASDAARSKGGGFGETIRTVIYAVLIAGVLRTFLFEPFSIPSGSMKPTLLVGDYLFVSKWSYGYSRYSFPFGLGFFNGRIFGDEMEVERGDVVVFRKPTDTDTDFIKRIVGLPGDRVQVIEGRLYLNQEMVERERLGEREVMSAFGRPTMLTEYRETLPGGRQHLIYEESDRSSTDNTRQFVVPEGHFFAMGDNRDNSTDSRFRDVGFIPFENLIGRAEIIFFSHNGSASWWEVWRWPFAIRFSRIFDEIQ